jgi:putative transposase
MKMTAFTPNAAALLTFNLNTELVRNHGISRGTYFNWRSKYGGVSVNELKRMKELEAENAKLKRMYADLALENAASKDVLSRKL